MSLINLPFDCLYDITSFLSLRSVSSILLTCSALHSQMTSDHAKFIWMNQLNYYLIAEIAYLRLPENYKSNSKSLVRQLRKQLENQEELLRRFESRSRRTHQGNDVNSYCNNNDDENRLVHETDDNDENFSRQYAVFSVYNSLKQLFYGGVLRRLRTNMTQILKQMSEAQSMRQLFDLFEKAVKNNDLSAFKGEGSEENEEELKRIQRQEISIWNIKNNTKSFLFYFLSGIVRLKEELDTSEDAASLVQRIIRILKQLVNQYHSDASEEGNGQAPLLLVIKTKNLDILREFVPLHNQAIVKNKTTQKRLLFNSNMRIDETLMWGIPLSTAIKEFVSVDMMELILEEVYEPNRKEMLHAVLGSRSVYYDGRYPSIFDYEWSWVQSTIEKYQVDISSISGHAFHSATISKTSSTPLELIRYLYSHGLRIKPVVEQKHYYSAIDDPFLSLLGAYRATNELEIIQCMQLLLDAGGCISHLPIFDNLIYIRSRHSYSIKMFQFLANNGADPNKIGSSNFPPLLSLISNFHFTYGSYEKMRCLLECGADPTLFFFSDNQFYQNTYMSALRMAYHRYVIHTEDSKSFGNITRLLAEYGVTKETEKLDPDGLTFDQWFQVASQE